MGYRNMAFVWFKYLHLILSVRVILNEGLSEAKVTISDRIENRLVRALLDTFLPSVETLEVTATNQAIQKTTLPGYDPRSASLLRLLLAFLP